MATEIKNLLIRLQDCKDPAKKRKLRKRLRVLGHEGGLKGKTIQVHKSKQLTPKERAEVVKHNRRVTGKMVEQILLRRGWTPEVLATYTPEQKKCIANQDQLPKGKIKR